jgi:DNA helicase-2/ATP-dependent DNA helicase PcrA
VTNNIKQSYSLCMNTPLSTRDNNVDSVEMFGLSLDGQQIKAATSNASRLAIIASAGSGKTRVITQRIKYLCETTDLKPNQVLAITFTRKAGFELAKRIRNVLGETNRLHPIVGTLHSFVMNELIDFYGDKKISSDSIIDQPEKILEQLKIKNSTQIAKAIAWCKTNLVFPQHLNDEIITNIRRHVRINPRELTLDSFKNSWESYENYMSKNYKYTHDDLLIKYIQLLEDPNYLETRQYLYRHLFVDEFQDSTRAHLVIFQKLVGEKLCISVVGDPDQSIFSFAGSSEKYLNNFASYFPGASIEFLSTNYRSTKANVEIARSVLGTQGKLRHIETPRQSMILPKVHLYSDELAEASGIMSILMSSHANGVAFADMAVLVRTNKQKDLIINAANSLGIAFHRGRRIELNESASEVFDTINTLRKKRRWKSVYDALDDISNIENEDELKKKYTKNYVLQLENIWTCSLMIDKAT